MRELANWYRTWAQMNSVMTRAYFETERFKHVLVVVPSSADPGVSGCAPVPVDGANHVTITTPEEGTLKNHPVYLGVQHVVSKVISMTRAGSEEPVFAQSQVFQDVLKAILDSKEKFKRIPRPIPKRFIEIPSEEEIRRDFANELKDLLRSKLEDGMLELSAVDEQAAGESQFDVDKLVLYLWMERKLKVIFSEMRNRIHSEVGSFNPQSNENLSLIPVYRSVRTLDRAILEDLPGLMTDLEKAHGQILVRRGRETKIKDDYKADADGSTRRLLRKVLCELKAMVDARTAFSGRIGEESDYDGARIKKK